MKPILIALLFICAGCTAWSGPNNPEVAIGGVCGPAAVANSEYDFDSFADNYGPSVQVGVLRLQHTDIEHCFLIDANACSGGRPGNSHWVHFRYDDLSIANDPCGPPYITESSFKTWISTQEYPLAGPVRWIVYPGYIEDIEIDDIRPGQQHIFRCRENSSDRPVCGWIAGITLEGYRYTGDCRLGSICIVAVEVEGFVADIYFSADYVEQTANFVSRTVSYIEAAIQRGEESLAW